MNFSQILKPLACAPLTLCLLGVAPPMAVLAESLPAESILVAESVESQPEAESLLFPVYTPNPRSYYIEGFSEGYAPLKLGGQWGFIDTTGAIIIPPAYDWVGPFSEGLATVTIDGKDGAINRSGELVIPATFSFIGSFSEGLARILVDDGQSNNYRFGYIDRTGEIVIPPRYDSAGPFSGGLAMVRHNGKAGYINPQGEMVIDSDFDTGSEFSDGIAFVSENYVDYVIDKTGRNPFPDPEVQPARPFSEGLAPLASLGRWGVMDRSGQVVVPPQYDSVADYSQGLAVFEEDGQFGYLDRAGNEAIAPQFDRARSFTDSGLAVVKDEESGWGFIDLTGTFVIEFQFDYLSSNFSDGFAQVIKEGKSGFLDTEGQFWSWHNGTFVEGWPTADEPGDTLWGYIDQRGQIQIPLQFGDARSFSEGLAAVQDINGRWGFIDETGNFVIDPEFDTVKPFSEGLAFVLSGLEDSWQILDQEGNTIAELPEGVTPGDSFSEGLAPAYTTSGYGYIDLTGKWIISPQFSYVGPFANGIAEVAMIDRPYGGYINLDGDLLWPPQESE